MMNRQQLNLVVQGQSERNIIEKSKKTFPSRKSMQNIKIYLDYCKITAYYIALISI